ncbi:hypothetical protein [Oceanisphaera sp. W20_SRM_FM3]|uniref:hypothetical protein n=1 Tax=Oceanisphaera sp. W20_SRM_FM3 TaxID=3240267 RepID=UPI003F9832AF
MEQLVYNTKFGSGSSSKPNLSSSSSATLAFEALPRVEVIRAVKQIISFVISDDFVEGEITKTQLYLEKLHMQNPYLFTEAFSTAWVQLFASDNEIYLFTLISVSSCLPYEWLRQHGDALILGCSSHESELVNEACIRLAESWEIPEHASKLEKMKAFECKWLESYRRETISYLKGLN